MSSSKNFTTEEEEKMFQKNFETENGRFQAGREYHGVETSAYWLPRDEDEQIRLTGVCISF